MNGQKDFFNDCNEIFEIPYNNKEEIFSLNFIESMGDMSSYVASSTYKPSKDKVKKLGQVFTPKEISEILAIWAVSNKPKKILDPSVGTGNLLTECRILDKSATLYGIELDNELFKIATSSTPKGTLLCNTNFLTAKLETFDSIISNPPYVKFHYRDLDKNEIKRFEKETNFVFSKLSNIYCLFIAKIHAILSSNGRAAIIVPSEFLNSNYGVSFKVFLQKVLNPTAILYFENKNSLFKDNLTTSAIILLDKSKKKGTPIPLLKVESLEALRNIVLKLSQKTAVFDNVEDVSRISPDEKWGNLSAILGNKKYGNKLKDFINCKRGIATGSNDFFCLSIQEINDFKIPAENLIPCITKAQHVDSITFKLNDLKKLKESNQKCFLFSPINFDENTKKYISYGEKNGINKKYLTKNRAVWYIPEKRKIANILIGVFFRDRVKCFRNYANICNLTCFHSIYANDDISELIVLFLNSTFGHEAIKSTIRSYGAGLNKLEPKDVESIPCPNFLKYKSNNIKAKEILGSNPQQSEIDNFMRKYLFLE